ncbi:MAG: hypothetical protein CMO80_17635 [Verrucomicrobiales bacterium]|nr:hypothetical protein [Verrucomicrobiales bacterium]|tara:strand:+ start:11980 stop:12210 length:231 start_codon:yes stop_codon:yes gene_type:complete
MAESELNLLQNSHFGNLQLIEDGSLAPLIESLAARPGELEHAGRVEAVFPSCAITRSSDQADPQSVLRFSRNSIPD